MGIQGLIPFLEKSSRQVSISQFSGCTVAIDAYCWLHKGAFACADKLARGDKTDVYVNYCMKYVNMLLSHNIKPILVFDGRHLPAKGDTEKKRRQNRETNRRKAAELLRQDKPNEARTFLQRCIDVTHSMALEVMRECRSRNVDCITAPYEADAQLAYLNIHNIAHVVITEDSDLLLFGCTKVLFKLDLAGNGLLVEQDSLHLAMGVSRAAFSLDKFRQMCILSGCDYLPSLPKIGLAKACRFIKSTVDPDIHRALSRLGGHLNMSISVPVEYRDKFVEAEAMFCHQPVFDPLTRRLVPLTPVPPGTTAPLLSQEKLDQRQLLDLALGNLDPFTLTRVDDWAPGKPQISVGKTNSWNAKLVAPHKSIWSEDFKPKSFVIEQKEPCKVKRPSTSGKVVEHKVDIPNLPVKRPLQNPEDELNSLRQQFCEVSQPPSKKQRCDDGDILDLLDKSDQTPPKVEVDNTELMESPKKQHHNPFSKSAPGTASKFSGLSKLAQFRKTTISETGVQSRYFNSSPAPPRPDSTTPQTASLKDVTNTNVMGDKEPAESTNTREVRNTERLSDSNITTLVQLMEEEEKEEKQNINKTGGKENLSVSSRVKHETSFKWKPSLADMFGFRSKSAPSTPSVRNGSTDVQCPGESKHALSARLENKTEKRNPFAKFQKIEDFSTNLGSEGSSLSQDSNSDTLTPDFTNSEESTMSSSSSPARSAPKPQIKVGLSKKLNGGCQKSLLTMFAFKPKAKLQR